MSNIVVIGSISTDFVVTTEISPKLGETVEGLNFERSFGGKGANQAVAAARISNNVSMVGAVGMDSFGQELLDNLTSNCIDVSNVERVTGFPSGSAVITLNKNDNAIIYVAGANNQFQGITSDKILNLLAQADLVVLQNEMPQAQIEQVIGYCLDNDIPVLYNPAPARVASKELIDKVTYFTPNESEFKIIFPNLTVSEGVKKYPNKLLVTLGSKGVLYHDGEREVLVPAYRVKPIDTTGAGDTFNGAFAAAIVKGMSIEDSVKFGNLAASLSIQKFGAQGGMPTLEEMEESLNYEKEWHIK